MNGDGSIDPATLVTAAGAIVGQANRMLEAAETERQPSQRRVRRLAAMGILQEAQRLLDVALTRMPRGRNGS